MSIAPDVLDRRAPLVGRRDEVAALATALKQLSAGRAGVLAFRGEPGIGKTRLLEELRQRAADEDVTFLAGRASELERELPFAVCVDALEDHLVEIGADRLERLVGDQAAELAPVAPDVSGLGEVTRGRLQDERYRTHRAVRALLEALGGRRPFVLPRDALPGADAASIELTPPRLPRPPRRGVLIALAYRPAPVRPVLATAIAAAARDSGLVEFVVDPLSRAESDALLGDDMPAPARDAIFAEGGGNPFYLQELARMPALVRAGPAVAGEVPRGVATLLAQEAAALSAPAQELARGAAVTGDPVDLDLAV